MWLEKCHKNVMFDMNTANKTIIQTRTLLYLSSWSEESGRKNRECCSVLFIYFVKEIWVERMQSRYGNYDIVYAPKALTDSWTYTPSTVHCP